ncbi:MAG: M4 family metallopeptidase, partial [Bacteroidota bacterium]
VLPLLLPAQRIQLNEDLAQIGYHAAGKNWITFHDYVSLSPQTLATTYKSAFGLGPQDALAIDKVQYEESGYVHHRYNMTHKGLTVEGAKWIIHAYQGKAIKANGFIPEHINVSPNPTLTAEQALQQAIDFVGAETYMWDVAGCEVMLGKETHDVQNDYMPIPQLMIVDRDFDFGTTNYTLAYRVDIFAYAPMSRRWIYVDAQTGEVLKELDMIHTSHTDHVHHHTHQTSNEIGTANTRYYGMRQITTTNTGNGYTLRENDRNGKGADVITLDLNESTNFGTAVDFTDDDNVWDATANADDAAYDAHWGAEQTYDYFLNVLGRDSYDGQGADVISYIHYDSGLFNAFWNGVSMTFGDGNGNPLTGLDVVAHEFAHGVTGNSAGLFYVNESGALNESFSDIFGNAIEHFALPNTSSWLINEATGTPFRNMLNPNQYGHPSFYKGNDWYNGTGDNGGVHFNSGVQNRWYTLLVEGGSGTNERGEPYTVSALGYDKATKIAYRNLNTYLTQTSQYTDARQGAIEAAIDLYGECSVEYEAVVNAWHAVGVGVPVLDGDFGIISYEISDPCGLTDEEELTIEIKYFGCDTFAGGTLILLYTVEDPFASGAEFVTVNNVAPLSTFQHTFQKKLDLSIKQSYRILSNLVFTTDPFPSNDSSELILTYNSFEKNEGAITFESFLNTNNILDTVHFQSGNEVTAAIKDKAGANESFGIEMEGGNRNRYNLTFGQASPFEANPNYLSKACICTDATNMDALDMSFDLRQTYSRFWETNLNIDSSVAAQNLNIMQVTVNGNPVGQPFSPTSHENDPYQTHALNLNAWVGQRLSICFEGMVNQSRQEDPFGIGDFIMIDNINLTPTYTVSSNDLTIVGPGLTIYPNPAQGEAFINFQAAHEGEVQLIVRNVLGQEVYQEMQQAVIGGNTWSLDIQKWSEGIYLIEVVKGEESFVQKLVVD